MNKYFCGNVIDANLSPRKLTGYLLKCTGSYIPLFRFLCPMERNWTRDTQLEIRTKIVYLFIFYKCVCVWCACLYVPLEDRR